MCDHKWIEATCTTPKTCSLCGKTEGEALGHIEEIIPAKAATCEESGLTEGVRCSRCGNILVKQQVIPALGHNYISEVTLEPTCTTDGIRTFTCSNGCGETYTEVISALGHNYVSEVIKPATCAEEGIIKHTCTRCEDTYEEVIPVLEHKQAIREENRVEPGCTNDGSYEEITYCTECGEVLNREMITLPALGHDYGDWVITKQPEVGIPGEQQKTCKRCGDVITEEIPALESEAKYYYLGGFGCDSQQDVPSTWTELEEAGYPAFNPETRAAHYVEEIKRNDAREYTDLIGQHELQWTITAPLGLDEAMTEVLEEDVIISESDTFYPAIVIPSNYKVTAWSTDAENTYSLTDQLNNIEISDNYTVYYIELATVAEAYGKRTPTFFITIAEK